MCERRASTPWLPLLVLLLPGCLGLPSKDELVDPDSDGSVYGEDCDNGDPAVHPGASEVGYDGVDNDCDPETSDSDLDGDGFDAEVSGGADCDDDNPAINPEASDTVDGSSTDQNCDGVDGTDSDGDGSASTATGGEDCDDSETEINPQGDERCDGLDNDCDGETDEDDASDAQTWYIDGDGDGYGDERSTVRACEQPASYAAEAGDCDDTLEDVNPAEAEEPYNGLDDDCDSTTPDDDLDEDGFESEAGGARDCDDDDSSVYPGAPEVCGDGVVNDCTSDEASAMGDCGLGGIRSVSDTDLKLVAEAAYAHASSAVSAAGDIDGDGLSDVLIGATGDSTAASYAGAAYLLLGGGSLSTTSSPGSLSSSDVKLTGVARLDGVGEAVSSAGDVDGDGLGDLMIGASGADVGGSDGGVIYVVLGGGALGSTSGRFELTSADIVFAGVGDGAYVGRAVAGLSDIDGDGLEDLAVGSPGDGDGGSYAGAAYLLLGGGVLEGASGTIEATDADLKLVGERSLNMAGVSVAGAGDVDGDGLGDLVVGVGREDTGGAIAGAAYMLLSAGELGDAHATLDLSDADVKFTGEGDYDYAGCAVGGAGDVDGDGLSDVLIGAEREESGGESAGAAYLLVGGGGLHSPSAVEELSGSDLKLIGESSDDFAGASVAGAGDVDDDGLDDVLVGATGESTAGSDAGAAYLLRGGGVLEGASGVVDLGDADLKLTGEDEDDLVGVALSGAGDVNGDGYDEVVIGAYNEDTAGREGGAAYLLLGGSY